MIKIVDVVVIALYLAGMAGMGFWFMRRVVIKSVGAFAVPAQLLLTIADGLWYTFPNLGKNHVLPIIGKWWRS